VTIFVVQIQPAGKAGYRNPLHCLRAVFRQEGWRGVFRGQLITVYREVPGFGTYFLAYESIARLLAGKESTKNLSTVSVLFAGGSAGCISWIVSYPSDVLKSRLQATNK